MSDETKVVLSVRIDVRKLAEAALFLDEVNLPPTNRSQIARGIFEAISGAAVEEELIVPVQEIQRAVEILEDHGITFRENEESLQRVSDALSEESLMSGTSEEQIEKEIEEAMERKEQESGQDDSDPDPPDISPDSSIIVDE